MGPWLSSTGEAWSSPASSVLVVVVSREDDEEEEEEGAALACVHQTR